MKKTVFLLLVILSVIALFVRFALPFLSQLFGYQEKSGLKITSTPEATVYINGKEVGKTPYQDENLQVAEYNVELQADSASWQSEVSLSNGTMAVINRELAPSAASSSGEILTLNPGRGVVVVSTPSGAGVEIDGQPAGKTPLSVSSLSSGEHTFILSHDGFLKRSIRASIPDGLALNIAVDLAVSELDLGVLPTPAVQVPVKLVVKQTSTGFLRLRDQPSTAGKELAQISSGEVLTEEEELSGWVKVQTDEQSSPSGKGVEGYVSAAYVSKLP